VAQPVVDVAQLVDVDHHQREVQRVAPRALELVAEPAIERVE